MSSFPKQRLVLRFLALGTLTLCLGILSRSNVANKMQERPVPTSSSQKAQTRTPILSTQTPPDAPLVISSPRIISRDGESIEVAIDLVNVSSKPIRAYAIKQALDADVTRSGQVLFTNLDLTNRSVLQPNQVTTIFDVYQRDVAKEETVVFLVDYVEFSDGTKWGADSANITERSAGQRACAYILSKRLLKTLNNSGPSDVIRVIDKGAANIEPPSGRPAEWKEGFRQGCKSIEQQLKRVQENGGLNQLDHELREFGQRFNGVK